MENRTFKWNKNPCLSDFKMIKKNQCWFDWWSIHHFYFQGFFYIIFHHFFKIKTLSNALKLNLIITILHIVEEYLGNTNKISLEGITADYIAPLLDPKINTESRELDNDYLQNSIGDILSGLLASSLIILYLELF